MRKRDVVLFFPLVYAVAVGAALAVYEATYHPLQTVSTPPPNFPVHTLTSGAVEKLVSEIVPKNYGLLDRKYATTDVANLSKLAAAFLSTKKEYREDLYDCDDYAIAFKAFASERGVTAVGIVYNCNNVSPHTFNVLVSYDGEVFVFDATNGAFFPYGAGPPDGRYELGGCAYLII
ncbi:lectin MOA-related protein [Archaeoglobus neptunius]|uniref:lectin MOA-related protein n=1 Tax=Archaeoglobus neptunius TaxID=2798580 RepID=UPI001927892C|nr:lectin MOA-related protein [Archaeoglobus neptunius]